ncbi:glycosyltransferase [Natronoflexus pectinivorans]|uniref:Glycosyltransferase involved in cell wall biosynthesis n=1 Tax=Natronoflexus pectinivorans TaxID=682526 RepID=A0A4R2GI58_9BACT|nr:glycosyltransferase [Natronoflexus pectinivorans]TCO07890.1 glycosyltransferase involved in cell wall biosynthesis [Natronoflexus pectinivorans]
MRILVVNTLYYPDFQGGAEKSVQLLCEGFFNRGHEVLVLSNSNLNNQATINGVNVRYFKTRNIIPFLEVKKYPSILRMIWHLIDMFNPFYFTSYKKIIDGFNPDVVLSNNLPGFSVSVWQFFKRKKIPVIHVLRDHALLCPKGTMFTDGKRCVNQCLRCRLMSLPKKNLSKNINGVIGISNYILQRHLNADYFIHHKVCKVIPNSVAFNGDHVKERTKDSITFGYFGRLCDEKGLGYLIEEYAAFNCNVRHKLLVGGDGEPQYVKAIKASVKNSNIEFLGFVSSEKFYEKIDYLIVPSILEEAFGRVVIEAWQYGVYVIAAKSGGMTELVEFGNLSLYDPSDEGALQKLLKTCAEQELKFNDDDYRLCKHHFDRDVVTNQYLEMIKKILG